MLLEKLYNNFSLSSFRKILLKLLEKVTKMLFFQNLTYILKLSQIGLFLIWKSQKWVLCSYWSIVWTCVPWGKPPSAPGACWWAGQSGWRGHGPRLCAYIIKLLNDMSLSIIKSFSFASFKNITFYVLYFYLYNG